MSSFGQQLNPRANVFLLVNLGCEMLYVIDQRLKAQKIAEDKSIQVIHDITAVLLEPKFIDSLIVGSTHANSQLLTAEHCKFMLNDIATCSLMRLDETSMGKLWNLMTMIYKWQLFVSKHQHHLLDITFRHLDVVGRLHLDEKRSLLVDFTKNTLLDFWNASGEEAQLTIYRTNKAWLQCFNTKISLLIRLGFQALDGSFFATVDQCHFQEFVDSIGDNVYEKSFELASQRQSSVLATSSSSTRRLDQLAEMLNFQPTSTEELLPIDATIFQKQFEQNLQQCNILFEDLDVNGSMKQTSTTTATTRTGVLNTLDANLFPDSSTQRSDADECVQLKTVYNRNSESSTSNLAGTRNGGRGLKKDLLELYSKMN